MQDLESMFLSMESTEEIYQEWENVDGYLTVPYSDDNIVYINNKEVGDMSINIVIVDESFSQYVQFEAPRYEDGVDLSQKRIYVHWEQGDSYAGDNVEAVNVKCTDDVIRFGWVVPAEALTINEEIRIMPFATGSHNGNNYVLKTLYGVLRPKESLKTTTGIIKPNEEWFLSFERKMNSYVEQGTDLLNQTKSSEEQARAIKTFMDDSIFAMAIVNEESGELIQTDDAANMALYEMSVFGKSQQFKTTGAQLANLPDVEATVVNGITWFCRDGVVIANGTANAYANTISGGIAFNVPIVAGVYHISGNTTNASVPVKIVRADGTVDYKSNSSFTLDGTETSCMVYCDVSANTTHNYTKLYPMLNVGDTALPWEPYTGGKASPNPEYPQEIESVGDDDGLEVGVYGANLIPYPYIDTTKTTNGITFTDNGDGSITVNGTATGRNATFELYKPTATDKFENTFISGAKDTNCIFEYTNKRTRTFADTGSGKAITFTHNIADFPNTVFHLQVDSGKTVNNVTIYPMLNAGDTALPWEPYTKQSVTFTTPNALFGIPVDSDGNYTDANGQQYIADEIRLNADGTGVWVHNVENVVFDGSSDESWYVNGPIFGGVNYRVGTQKLKGKIVGNTDNSVIPHVICTHGKADSPDKNYRLSESITVDVRGSIYFYSESFNTSDITLWTAHLAENPMTVLYRLAEPYETELSAEEIEAFLLLRMNKYINNVFNDERAYQRIKYIADPKTYINNKITEAIQTITEPV